MTTQKKSDRITIRFTPEEYAALLLLAPGGRVAPYVRALALDSAISPDRRVDCIDELDAIIARANEVLARPNLSAAELDRLTQALKRGREIRVAEVARLKESGDLIAGDVVRHGLQSIQEGVIDLTGDNLEVELSGYGVPRERVSRLQRELLENMRRFVQPGGDV